jgi:hypothetical protein
VIALVVAAVVVLAAIGAGLFFLLGESGSEPTASATTSAGPATSTSEEATPSEPSSRPPPPTESPSPTDVAAIPEATETPDGLGDDPVLDELAQSCYDGDMQACDDLYSQSEEDSAYELYGGTCAGRQEVSASDTVYCTDAFPGG